MVNDRQVRELMKKLNKGEVVSLERLAEHDGRSVDTLLARPPARPRQRALRVAVASDPELRRGARVAVAGIGAGVRAWSLTRSSPNIPRI